MGPIPDGGTGDERGAIPVAYSARTLAQIHASERMRLARSIGYGRVSAWFKSVVPALYPLLRLPLYAVIAYSSANIDVALILGPVLSAAARGSGSAMVE